MRHLFLTSTLLLFGLTAAAPVAAEGQFETLDPGPLPEVLPPKPAPFDWRREAPPGGEAAKIAAAGKRRPPSTTKPAGVPALAPMFPPPDDELELRRAYEESLAERRRLGRSAYRIAARSRDSKPKPPIGDQAPEKEFLPVKASPVFMERWRLEAGRTVTIETRGLSAGGDTVLYVVRNGEPLAFSDDRAEGDLSSRVRFTPAETDDYVILVRALDEARAGTCDLFLDGQARRQEIAFGGTVVRWKWQAGDRFQTAHLPSTYANPVDTLLLAFDGLKLVGWNDDGGIGGCSALTLHEGSTSEEAHVLVAGFLPDGGEDWVTLYRNALSGPDEDGDTLADSLEVSLGTDSKAIDTDGDGLRDDWEIFGLRTLQGEEDLPSYAGVGVNRRRGTDPRVKDLFLEIDWMSGPKGQPGLLRPLDKAVELVTRQFWQSGGIVLHVDLGQMGSAASRGGQQLPYQESFDRTGTEPLSLEACYSSPDWFAPGRRHLFCYLICGSRFPDRVSSGHMVRFKEDGTIHPSALFHTSLSPGAIVCMGSAINGSLTMEAGTIMHELGHCLNLQHGGFQSFPNFKPNYLSSMNYMFQFGGLDEEGAPDYSHGHAPAMDERALDEVSGVGPVSDLIHGLLRRGRNVPAIRRREDLRTTDFPTAFDWDNDGRISDGRLRFDYNADGTMSPFRDHNDWAEVRRPGGGLSWVGVNAGVEGWVSDSGKG